MQQYAYIIYRGRYIPAAISWKVCFTIFQVRGMTKCGRSGL